MYLSWWQMTMYNKSVEYKEAVEARKNEIIEFCNKI